MGEEHLSNIWIGGALEGELKLGWIMKNVVELCARFAKKKTGGRMFFDLGSKTQAAQVGFPIKTLFLSICTPAGEVPPKLGDLALDALKWPGAGLLEVDTTSTYTLVWNTPFLDLCSWELLKVPGISPLPLESVLGDISSAHVFVYDLGKAGSHANWRNSLLMESFFSRGAEGETWAIPAPVPEGVKDEAEDKAQMSLEAAEDDAEAEDEAEEDDAEDEDLVTQRDDQSDSSDSQSGSDQEEAEEAGDEELNDEMLRELNKLHAEALFKIEGWRPRQMAGTAAENAAVQVPYYIEAIDRLQRRKVRVWYVFAMANPDGAGTWWHAKDSAVLASLCKPKRRLQTFRRGPGARRFACCAVRTLEQFRQVVGKHLATETKLRSLVIAAAANGAMTPRGMDRRPMEEVPSPSSRSRHLSPSRLARKVRRRATGWRRVPVVPPQFFVAADSVICGLAFAHARQGREEVLREALVGCLHFEGRLCEELLRLSSDGVLRCFTPYDCEQPRVRILASEILQVEAMPGLFLGRFHIWQVHTLLHVFAFCCAEAAERDEWVSGIGSVVSQGSQARTPSACCTGGQTPSSGFEEASPLVAADPTPPTPPTPPATGAERFAFPAFGVASTLLMPQISARSIAKKATGLLNAMSSLRAIAIGQPVPSREADLLMDSTKARRWGRRRLVLNDRKLVTAPEASPLGPSIAGQLLETALALGEQPDTCDVIAFMDFTCLLKAVRFDGWKDSDLLAFWMNIYHCMLLHGLLVLGVPKLQSEVKHFHNRVSYLIGPMPVSLREIEHAILRVPAAEKDMADMAVRTAREARVRAQALLSGLPRPRHWGPSWGCGLRFGLAGPAGRKPSPSQSGSFPRPASPVALGSSGGGIRTSPTNITPGSVAPNFPQVEQGSARKCDRPDTDGNFVGNLCLPKLPLPRPPWRNETNSACLYLGAEPQALATPQKDLRVALALNRGTLSCPPSVPVFSAARLNAELDEVACCFARSFVSIQLGHGRRPVHATLPYCCQGIMQELGNDQEALLRFLGRILEAEATKFPLQQTQKVQVRFKKGPEDPRQRSELCRHTFSDPNLQKLIQAFGPEFNVIHGTAQALSKLVEAGQPPEGPPEAQSSLSFRECDSSPKRGADAQRLTISL
ncbi:unnamed protein product [Polarella glacialis]|uniref:DUF547 domain-containing protein n=1 Tax=Polarella glacialis TaxID=89957 RepID=A0A813KSF5_POLGL|nr:unnamed protein product [Polarella glacialis]